ncbi:Uncharacterised protein [Vibrio cholerae]|nr:Uncharacterised protein [Vibrio cholerae]
MFQGFLPCGFIRLFLLLKSFKLINIGQAALTNIIDSGHTLTPYPY